MPSADLSGVAAKIAPAEEHHRELTAQVDRWAQTRFGHIAWRVERNGDWHALIVEPIASPGLEAAVIAGELIHNLRSALDHLVWQTVIRDGSAPSRRNQFPLVDDAQAFASEVRNTKNSPLSGIEVDGDAWRIFEQSQPYNSSPVQSSALRAVGRLSNLDKHRTSYVGMTFPPDNLEVTWNPELKLIEQRIEGKALSSSGPAEIARYRFARDVLPGLPMLAGLAVTPSFGEPEAEDAVQVSVGGFGGLISRVRTLVDSFRQLPRVQG